MTKEEIKQRLDELLKLANLNKAELADYINEGQKKLISLTGEIPDPADKDMSDVVFYSMKSAGLKLGIRLLRQDLD